MVSYEKKNAFELQAMKKYGESFLNEKFLIECYHN